MSGSGTVITLPAVSASNGKHVLTFFNGGSVDVTIRRAGANVFYPDGGGTTQIVLGQYDTLSIESDGNNGWMVVGGSAQLKRAGVFGNSSNTIGYQRLPSGLILQWGTVTLAFTPGTLKNVTLPITFPNACLRAFGAAGSNGSQQQSIVGAQGLNASTIQLWSWDTNTYSAQWFAIGN